jgi:hypothetical protein
MSRKIAGLQKNKRLSFCDDAGSIHEPDVKRDDGDIIHSSHLSSSKEEESPYWRAQGQHLSFIRVPVESQLANNNDMTTCHLRVIEGGNCFTTTHF